MYSAGFDIGGTNARLRVFDEACAIVHEARASTREDSSPEAIAAKMAEMLGPAPPVDGVGVGIAGLLSADGRAVENSPNLGWRDVAFLDVLERAIPGRRFVLANDLNAMLWGELQAGAVRGATEVLAVYVGTGVGGAIVSDGRLVLGGGGKAGEIGHSKVVVGGRPCGCGGRGCVEAYAGGVHLEALVAAAAPELDRDLAAADAVADSDERVEAIWETATDYLAIVVANACTLLNPSVLLIGGGVLENLEAYRLLFLRKLTPLIVEPARADLEIKFGELDEAAVLGAALLAR